LLLVACGSNGKDSTGGGGTTTTSQAGATSTDTGFACTTTADPGDMVAVAAGPFVMGCNDAVDKQCADDEKPKHDVTLAAFEIDRTEVTQAAYTACIVDGACSPPSCDWNCDHPNFPAGCVTWAQASSYCSWAQKRLPSEAEWEKAARGEQGNKYPWGNNEPTCSLGNVAGCGDSLKDVGSASAGASPYGALDMAGNVVELVADFYDEGYYADSPAADPKGPATGKRYSGRGGGFKSDADFVRASKRDWYDPTDTAPSLGFRCAR
jgi:formylglycine-generating enzyme required for sulfatase activity